MSHNGKASCNSRAFMITFTHFAPVGKQPRGTGLGAKGLPRDKDAQEVMLRMRLGVSPPEFMEEWHRMGEEDGRVDALEMSR